MDPLYVILSWKSNWERGPVTPPPSNICSWPSPYLCSPLHFLSLFICYSLFTLMQTRASILSPYIAPPLSSLFSHWETMYFFYSKTPISVFWSYLNISTPAIKPFLSILLLTWLKGFLLWLAWWLHCSQCHVKSIQCTLWIGWHLEVHPAVGSTPKKTLVLGAVLSLASSCPTFQLMLAQKMSSKQWRRWWQRRQRRRQWWRVILMPTFPCGHHPSPVSPVKQFPGARHIFAENWEWTILLRW